MTHLTEHDLHTILTIFIDTKWRGAEICRTFPSKQWSVRAVNRAIKIYEDTGSILRREGSGRLATVITDENQVTVENLAASLESQPGTYG